jgi:hypothetical protein
VPTRSDELRLSRSQAIKLWDRAFATTWAEIGPTHPSRAVMVKLARFVGMTPEIEQFIATGQIDPTLGMPRGARYVQVAAEEANPNPQPDFEQSERMHAVAARTAQQPGGGVVAGSF